ncbi:MAG: hypothetical protein IT365_07480 [Candidatus Hydrogenedentes bacterium]|nr:hypothetical protein [Candidatus Hydrogenedentota bacterium]
MSKRNRRSLAEDLVFPTLLFMALGGMTWAVRGCSGYGGSSGCIFAGVTWGAAWWFISRNAGREQSRPYSSGWIVLAMTVGIGFAGSRGWAQWPNFFEGHLSTNAQANEFVPISRAYGFLWLFIAGMPWAGLGAGLLAWCSSQSRLRGWEWLLRVACVIGGGLSGWYLFVRLPEVFLPLYKSIPERYHDLKANPSLGRLINDNRSAITHLGLYLGFLAFEVFRRDWRNVRLILTVGVVSGLGWALFQNWKWAEHWWPDARFNFWRCWESSGGLSIGLAYGLAFFLANGRLSPEELAQREIHLAPRLSRGEWLTVYLGLLLVSVLFLLGEMGLWGIPSFVILAGFGGAYYLRFAKEPILPRGEPSLERFGLYIGLLLGLGLSIRNGVKGWFNIYVGNEDYWSAVLWWIAGPLFLVGFIVLALNALMRPHPNNCEGEVFPHAYGLLWLVLITQNILAQLVTGPLTNWGEVVFSIYYVLLFALSAVIIHHYRVQQTC